MVSFEFGDLFMCKWTCFGYWGGGVSGDKKGGSGSKKGGSEIKGAGGGGKEK